MKVPKIQDVKSCVLLHSQLSARKESKSPSPIHIDTAPSMKELEPVDFHHTDSFAVYHLNLLGLVSQNNPLPSKYKENIKTSLCEGGTLFLQNISTRKANLMAEDEELQKLGIKPNSVLVVYVKSNARWNDKNIERVLKKLPWIWDVRVDISGQLELVVK